MVPIKPLAVYIQLHPTRTFATTKLDEQILPYPPGALSTAYKDTPQNIRDTFLTPIRGT